MPSNLILTFGYGNRTSYAELQSALKGHTVSYLIDVRKKPRGWSAIWGYQKLQDFCESIGITYISKRELGNDSGNSQWIPPDYEQAETALEDVSRIAEAHNILLLCAEKDWKRCHRTNISERLQSKTGNQVVHVI